MGRGVLGREGKWGGRVVWRRVSGVGREGGGVSGGWW